jgi:hypothetical protein
MPVWPFEIHDASQGWHDFNKALSNLVVLKNLMRSAEIPHSISKVQRP